MNDIKQKFEDWYEKGDYCFPENEEIYEDEWKEAQEGANYEGFKTGAKSMLPENNQLRKALENNIKAMKAYEKNGLLCGNLIIARQEAEQALKDTQ